MAAEDVEVAVAAAEVTVEAKADDQPVKKTKAPKEKKPRAPRGSKPAAPHLPYLKMIIEAISALKERNGSSQQAIAKFIEGKYKTGLPPIFKKLLSVQLKNLVQKGKLVQVKHSYKLSETLKKGAPKPATAKPSVPKKANKPLKGTVKASKSPKMQVVKAAKPAAKPKSKAAAKAVKPEALKAVKPKVAKAVKAAKPASAGPKKAAAPRKAPKKAATPKKAKLVKTLKPKAAVTKKAKVAA